MNIILFDEHEVTAPLPANDERSRHLLKILHKTEGDFFEAGIVNGKAGKARITRIRNGEIFFDFASLDGNAENGKPLYPLVMLIGFVRPIQLKRIFRDMTGLGVSEIHLFASDTGEKSYLDSDIIKNGSANRILREGAMQAKSVFLPRLFVHDSLDAALDSVIDSDMRFFALDNAESTQTLCEALTGIEANVSGNSAKKIAAAIGSERGWSNRERILLRSRNIPLCSTGSRILRTESAATVAATLILAAQGFL